MPLSADAHRVLRLADAHGLAYAWLPPGETPEGTTRGPRGHYIDMRARKALLEAPSDVEKDLGEPEVLLHELAHLYTHPPFWNIEDTAEDFVLMQWERSAARHCLPKRVYHNVLKWQQDTVSCHAATDLGRIQRDLGYDYRQTSWWRAGFLLLRKLGGLTPEGKPTWKPLRWDLLRPQDIRDLEVCIEDGSSRDGLHMLDLVRRIANS